MSSLDSTLGREALRPGTKAHAALDDRRRTASQAIKAAMAGDQIVAPAITRRLIEVYCRAPSPQGGTPAAFISLTPREVEVLTLVGRGLTNAEIARRLFVAETTVKTHVARMLSKLDLRDCTQAVIAAYENGLVRPGEALPGPPT
jgi:DNA-binding NarL/FixJ family response regulator